MRRLVRFLTTNVFLDNFLSLDEYSCGALVVGIPHCSRDTLSALVPDVSVEISGSLQGRLSYKCTAELLTGVCQFHANIVSFHNQDGGW